jgi:hypothetical protein
MEYKELIDSFAKANGIDDIVIEDGAATLVIDFTAVTIREAVNVRAIIVSAVIGGAVPDAKGRLASFMLQANHAFCETDGMTICQNPETDEYLLLCFIPNALANAKLLTETVEALTDTAMDFRAKLRAFVDVDMESAQKEEEEREFNPLFGGYFIRV